MAGTETTPPITGRCYCGKTTISASSLPSAVTYCHCSDCRRVTGGPVAVYAAFNDADVALSPDDGRQVIARDGSRRTFCATCGSPLTGRYDYLPGQVYIAIGLIDQAASLAPQIHAHTDTQLDWLHIEDDLPRAPGSARSVLNQRSE